MAFDFNFNTANSLVRGPSMVSLDAEAGQLPGMPKMSLKSTDFNMNALMGREEEKPELTDPLKMIRNQSLYMGMSALQGLSSLSGNSYQNSLKRYNQQHLAPGLNTNLYSTRQDLYGTSYAKLGGLKRYDDGGDFQNLANEYNFLAQENPEDADFYHNQAAEYAQQFQAFQQKQMQDAMYETLEQHAANAVAPVQEEIYPYTPQPWSTTLGPDNSSASSYAPSFAPSLNIGFNPSNQMYNKSQTLEGLKYQMGAKGSNGKIDCSGAVCKIVGAPTQTSEDITRHGKNFRQFQGVQDLQEGAVLGFDFGPKKHDRGRQYGIDHTGVIVRNPKTKQLEYKESVSGTGFRTLTIPQLMAKYPSRAKKIFISNYQ